MTENTAAEPVAADVRTVTPFVVRLDVRSYEIDPQLHVSGTILQQYADHSRFACVIAAGVSVPDLLGGGMGPVNLETTIRYHHELRGGETVDVSCGWVWGTGKTYKVVHELRLPDGTLVAEIVHVSGLLDLQQRRLVTDPAEQWRSRAAHPELLGL
ncbi:acyl-CoA thioesterase [Nocardia sp. NPDC020380]|uniref:acyl-CoA thioesterase n=1 Tax=Nocardia sp. NPDC020380 TaxID=3364309 RepID=UPI00378BABC2